MRPVHALSSRVQAPSATPPNGFETSRSRNCPVRRDIIPKKQEQGPGWTGDVDWQLHDIAKHEKAGDPHRIVRKHRQTVTDCVYRRDMQARIEREFRGRFCFQGIEVDADELSDPHVSQEDISENAGRLRRRRRELRETLRAFVTARLRKFLARLSWKRKRRKTRRGRHLVAKTQAPARQFARVIVLIGASCTIGTGAVAFWVGIAFGAIASVTGSRARRRGQ